MSTRAQALGRMS